VTLFTVLDVMTKLNFEDPTLSGVFLINFCHQTYMRMAISKCTICYQFTS